MVGASSIASSNSKNVGLLLTGSASASINRISFTPHVRRQSWQRHPVCNITNTARPIASSCIRVVTGVGAYTDMLLVHLTSTTHKHPLTDFWHPFINANPQHTHFFFKTVTSLVGIGSITVDFVANGFNHASASLVVNAILTSCHFSHLQINTAIPATTYNRQNRYVMGTINIHLPTVQPLLLRCQGRFCFAI